MEAQLIPLVDAQLVLAIQAPGFTGDLLDLLSLLANGPASSHPRLADFLWPSLTGSLAHPPQTSVLGLNALNVSLMCQSLIRNLWDSYASTSTGTLRFVSGKLHYRMLKLSMLLSHLSYSLRLCYTITTLILLLVNFDKSIVLSSRQAVCQASSE